ncbi:MULTISPECIES: YitT family protein [Clostridium]|uniref:YitT family protein n=1 Tax=Clostridium senegalense TaxID=1465809 RepID=A0A6M0H3H7_9CLOT|nr:MULTISPECIES: YitT family protein [Clostridium]NEU04421.1 YitT family protein [Clostridium senegalense]
MDTKVLDKANIIDLLFIILGSFVSSIGINMFLIHAKLLSGGVTGVALIFQYLFKIQAGYIILLLNIPLFILSFKKLDKKFTIYSLVGTLSLSLSLILTSSISNILNITDTLLYCLYGGVLNGIGFGLIFAHHGSTGGFDIISMLIKRKHTTLNIGKISFGINLIIVSISAFVFGLTSALYTLIAMYTTAFVLDNVVKGLNQTKSVFIITNKEDLVSNFLMKNLHRGVTYLYGEGAYSKDQRRILYCIIPLSQLPELKNIVTSIDEKAFISISDTSEVHGRGFKQVL